MISNSVIAYYTITNHLTEAGFDFFFTFVIEKVETIGNFSRLQIYVPSYK